MTDHRAINHPWLSALKREGLHFGALAFLRLGVVVMLPALFFSLAVRLILP